MLRRLLIFVLAATASVYAQQAPSPASTRVPTLLTPAVAPELIRPAAQLTPERIGHMQKKLADWPQLNKYREENSRLGLPGSGEPRVIFYGDSITAGWIQLSPNFFANKSYVDRGISGQTTQQMVARFYQDVVALRPDAVVILAGINDIAGNTGPETLPTIEDNFRAMVSLAKGGHIRVVLSSLLPASRIVPRPNSDPTDEVIELNRWLSTYASQEHITFLNYYPSMVDSIGGLRSNLTKDGAVHPNQAGYAVMEPLVKAAIDNTMAKPRP